MRKCEQLKTKKEKAAAAKASGQHLVDSDHSQHLNGQAPYGGNSADQLQLTDATNAFQQSEFVQVKNINQPSTPGTPNLFDLNSSYSNFPPQQTILPFNGQINPADTLKMDHQGLLSDQQSTEYSNSAIHPVTNVRLKNLILNRQNQKEQLQNFVAASQNMTLYSDPPVSPIPVHPTSIENDNYNQQTPPTPTSMRSRAGSNPTDSGIQSEDSSYLNQTLTYEPLRNLALPSPDSDLAWRKSSSPSAEQESMLKSNHKSLNGANDGVSFSGPEQGSINGYGYQSFFESGNSDANGTGSNSEEYSTSNNTSPQKYSNQNAQQIYSNQYFQSTTDMNSYTGMAMDTSQVSFTPTSSAQTNGSSSFPQNQSSPPVSREPLPSPYNQSFNHQSNGKGTEGQAPMNGSESTSTVSNEANKDSNETSESNVLLLSSTSMSTYTNTINSYNTTYAASKSPTSLPAISSIFSSANTVISNTSDMAPQLKVTYAGSQWMSNAESGRNEEFCGLDSASLGGIFSSLVTNSMSSPALATLAVENGKSFALNQQESNWWEQMKNNGKIEVPPASPDCEVLENRPSSPSTLPTSL